MIEVDLKTFTAKSVILRKIPNHAFFDPFMLFYFHGMCNPKKRFDA